MEFDQILGDYRQQYPPTLNTTQVAEMAGSTPEAVRTKVARGEIPAYRWGKNFRYFRTEVLDWLRRQQVKSGRDRTVTPGDFTDTADGEPGVVVGRADLGSTESRSKPYDKTRT